MQHFRDPAVARLVGEAEATERFAPHTQSHCEIDLDLRVQILREHGKRHHTAIVRVKLVAFLRANASRREA